MYIYVYVYIWKCHHETPCITIINKQKGLLKNDGHEGKTQPVQVLLAVGGGEHKRRVKEGEYGESTMYSCIKTEQ
jgi:hypothetical protein